MNSAYVRTYVALGSNIDDPQAQIQSALAALNNLPQTQFVCSSSLIISPPLPPVVDQPDIINAVVALDTELAAIDLLHELQKIEHNQGRIRIVRWGPRSLDLDILLYGDLIINTPELTVPHPGIRLRNFVLYPLAEIAPTLILPTGETLQSLLKLYPAPTKITSQPRGTL